MMRKPLYILIASFFPKPGSWRCTYGSDYAQAILRTGKYDVVVFMPDYDGEYECDGIMVYGFPLERVSDSGAFYYLKYRQNQKNFLEVFDRNGFDAASVAVCEAYNGNLGYLAWALKKRNEKMVSVLHHHSLGSFGIMFGSKQNFWPIKVLNFLWMRYVHEHQDLHVFISKKCRESFLRFPDTHWTIHCPYRNIGAGLSIFRSVRIRDSYILHNGVDCRIFNMVGRKPHTVFKIGCVANFQQLKGQLTLLKALNSIKGRLGNWSLRFIGSGSTKEECEQYVKVNGLSAYVEFFPEIRHHELPDFYRELDLYVMPSYFEGFGCVYTEAWSCGTPFIACKGQGTDDLFSEPQNSPWLVPVENENELAKRILEFYINRPSQELVCPIDIDVLVPQYLDYLERAVAR